VLCRGVRWVESGGREYDRKHEERVPQEKGSLLHFVTGVARSACGGRDGRRVGVGAGGWGALRIGAGQWEWWGGVSRGEGPPLPRPRGCWHGYDQMSKVLVSRDRRSLLHVIGMA